MSNQEKNWHAFTISGDPMYYLEFSQSRNEAEFRGKHENDKSAGFSS